MAISAESSEAVLLAAGKKRGFCQRGGVGAISAESSEALHLAAGKKRGFCQRGWRWAFCAPGAISAVWFFAR
jgi:outer membrane protease